MLQLSLLSYSAGTDEIQAAKGSAEPLSPEAAPKSHCTEKPPPLQQTSTLFFTGVLKRSLGGKPFPHTTWERLGVALSDTFISN